ncbi:MAG: hypothetical protein AB1659_13135, partial [Thermodesulfobacteriota bacterium]
MKYGRQVFSLILPEHAECFDIRHPLRQMDGLNFQGKLHQALERMKPDFSRTSVVVSDKTRLCQYPEYLHLLLQELETEGA